MRKFYDFGAKHQVWIGIIFIGSVLVAQILNFSLFGKMGIILFWIAYFLMLTTSKVIQVKENTLGLRISNKNKTFRENSLVVLFPADIYMEFPLEEKELICPFNMVNNGAKVRIKYKINPQYKFEDFPPLISVEMILKMSALTNGVDVVQRMASCFPNLFTKLEAKYEE